MKAIEVKISQIKNLNLIYLYHVDDVFESSKNKKYLGLKVLYDNNQGYINLDYKDEFFAYLLKHTINVYNQEKDNRDIILLGDLSKKLLQDEEIVSVSQSISHYNDEGVGLFSTSNELIRPFKPYLFEALKHILENIRKMECIEIIDIKGFNKKYIVTFEVGGVSSSFPIILYPGEVGTLHFKIGAIAGENAGIEGFIVNNLDKAETYWRNIEGKNYGYTIYDIKNYNVIKNVTIGCDAIYHTTELDTVSDEDIELVKFYLNLFHIDFSGEIIKTSDNNFILGNKTKVFNSDEAEVIKENGIQAFIEDEEVTINIRISNIINRLKHLVTVPLDEEFYNIILKKRCVDGCDYIICEMKERRGNKRKFDYVAFAVDEIDLHHPFNIKETIEFDEEIKSLYDLEKKLTYKRINKEKLEGEEN